MITYEIISMTGKQPLASPIIRIECQDIGSTYLSVRTFDAEFKNLIDELYDHQQYLMQREYEAVLQAIESYNKGKATSMRSISRGTAEYCYRMDVPYHVSTVIIDLPSYEATYKFNKKGKLESLSQKDLQLMSGIERALPPLDLELQATYDAIIFELSELKSSTANQKEITQ